MTVGQMIVKEGVDRRPGHALDGGVLGGEPDSEVLNPLNVLLNGARGMAALVEVIDVGLDPGTRRFALKRHAREGGGSNGPAWIPSFRVKGPSRRITNYAEQIKSQKATER